MKYYYRLLASWLALCSTLLLAPSFTFAQHYTQTNLVSDISTLAPTLDANLKNPWGLTRSADGGPWWVANNNSGTSTLYDGNGNKFPAPADGGQLIVIVPPPKSTPGAQSAPTGIVFNGSPDFEITPGNPAIFIFVTEDGTISGWNFNLNDGTHAVLKVDNSDDGAPDGAVYKGATTAELNGKRFLYVTNFRSGKVEVYDSHFKRAHFGEEAFDDDQIPVDFAPFNVQNIGGDLFVTYAKQDALRHDPVHGDGGGFVDIFSPAGKFLRRLQNGPWFNAPWGVVWTPRDFGEFSNSILVGNFRSGWIADFDGFTGEFRGFMKKASSNARVLIDGIWSLTFGNNGLAGPSTTLFFTAGINNETNGLFGTLTPVAAELDADEE
jgi:uncharacterized protein (TIGR03118 family)